MPFLAFLVSPLGRFCGYALIALIVLATVLGVKAEWDHGQAAIKQVAQIRQTSKIQTHAVAKADAVVSKMDQAAQARIVIRYRVLTKEIPHYVPVSSPCIPWGVVRVHDAAVLGVDPSTLQAPAGQADDACSDVDTRAFVATIVANYKAAEANAQQLNDLIADANARATAVTPTTPPQPPY